jgi:hypothetical protein
MPELFHQLTDTTRTRAGLPRPRVPNAPRIRGEILVSPIVLQETTHVGAAASVPAPAAQKNTDAIDDLFCLHICSVSLLD